MGPVGLTDDEVDFDVIVSYNNASFIPLHNAIQDRSATDPLQEIDPHTFVVERMKAAAAQAPQLAPSIQTLAQTYQLA
jgi:hypothetical protein